MLRFFDKDGNDITDISRLYCANPACPGEPFCSAWGICNGTTAKQPANTLANTHTMEEAIASGSGLDHGIYMDALDEFDSIFLAASPTHLSSYTSPAVPSSFTLPMKPHSSFTCDVQQHKQRFAPPKTNEEVEAARKGCMPKKTRDDMEYCMRVWKEWRKCRQNTAEITNMTNNELDEALCRFVLEMRRKDGKQYPPNSVHHICCGVMRYLRLEGQHEIDFFKDRSFSHFRDVLDSEMKRLQGEGVGSKHRQAEPITLEEEEVLWQKGQLGQHSGRALVDTMLYMCGTYFALRSGQEHRALRFYPSQIELIEKNGERAFLRYTEDISKNHQGGLKGRKQKAKVVTHHENTENPSRCFVNLYKLYQSKCPIKDTSISSLSKTLPMTAGLRQHQLVIPRWLQQLLECARLQELQGTKRIILYVLQLQHGCIRPESMSS